MGAPNAAPRAAEVQNRARSRATASAASIPAGRRATTTRRGQADGRRGVSEGGDDGQQLQHPPSRGADGGRARGREADSGAGRPPRRAEMMRRRRRRSGDGTTVRQPDPRPADPGRRCRRRRERTGGDGSRHGENKKMGTSAAAASIYDLGLGVEGDAAPRSKIDAPRGSAALNRGW